MNSFGENLKITVFGEAQGPMFGLVLDGLPAGIEVDEEYISAEIKRRAPGVSELGSERDDGDDAIFASGIFEGKTSGAPLVAMIRNTDQLSSSAPSLPRPSHADLTAYLKYAGFNDQRGGGPFSGRITAPITLAGALCRSVLMQMGISIAAKIVRVGEAVGDGLTNQMKKEILDARASGDSVGGIVECEATGVPVGLGGQMFGGMEPRLAAMLFAVPGVRGVEFGAGFDIAHMRGSRANDPIRLVGDSFVTETNNSGGINGGITNGMPLVLRCAFRPTPSIAREQKTVNLNSMENTVMRVRGRHDPCIAPRAVPVVEACMAFCLLDAIYDHDAVFKQPAEKTLGTTVEDPAE